MNQHTQHHRLIAGTLLATIALAALAPAAYADHGWGHAKKGGRDGRPPFAEHASWGPRGYAEFHRHSEGGATLAGFLGGLAVGAIVTSAVVSHPAPAPVVYSAPPPACDPAPAYDPPPGGADDQGYSYEDPYCHERFASLEVYMAHDRRFGHHPLVAQVIDDRDGRCVDVIRYDGGRWESVGANDGDNGDDYGDQ